jgi:hypothetical protein
MTEIDSSIDWNEIAKSKKGVRTNDNVSAGNVIAETGDNIIISAGAVKEHEYIVPKDKLDFFDGAEVHLNISHSELAGFEVPAK